MNPTHPDRSFATSLEINASRDLVWKALSDASELVRWFAPSASVEPGVGGTVEWEWPELHDWPQTIEVWDEGRRLRTRYDSTVEDGAGGKLPLFIEFLLEGDSTRTTLRLIHSGFGPGAEFDDEFDGISRGWMVELRSLKLYLEQHAGSDRTITRAQHPITIDRDTAWNLLTGPDGLNCGADISSLAEGTPFSIDRFEGTTLCAQPFEFSGRVANYGDAWLRMTVESCGGQSSALLWLATYDRTPTDLAEVHTFFENLLRRVFSATKAEA